MPILVGLSGMNKNESRKLPEQGSLTLGRGEKNDICVMDRKSSRNHCRLLLGGGQVVLEDLNSTNGVFVNGERVSGKRLLAIGDRLAIGQTVFELLDDGAEEARPGESMESLRRKRDNLLQMTTFPATKTTSLRKVNPDVEEEREEGPKLKFGLGGKTP